MSTFLNVASRNSRKVRAKKTTLNFLEKYIFFVSNQNQLKHLLIGNVESIHIEVFVPI